MSEIIDVFINGYISYAGYLWNTIIHPSWDNYFYWLIGVSTLMFLLEFFQPWRVHQKTLRKDFWLDIFYMFFNFFLFSLIVYNAISDVGVFLLNDFIQTWTGIDLQSINPLREWPLWAVLLIGFVVKDFIQWWVHRLLHRVSWLWEFHKVHHSVEEMGFAAHLRYHWMETVVYRTIEYIPLALLGIGLYDFFIIHIFTIIIGHYNHSNWRIDGKITGGLLGLAMGFILAFGWFGVDVLPRNFSWIHVIVVLICLFLGVFVLGKYIKKIFNSPEMHIWHHVAELPKGHTYGINFGISLAIWDYIFGTAAIPYEGRDIRLGFDHIEHFPQDFWGQSMHGIIR